MEIVASSRLDGIGEYYFSVKLRQIEQMNREGKDVINLGIGNPDLPPHPDVISVLQEESAKPAMHGYQSYKGSAVFREAIAEWYKQWYGVDVDPVNEVLPLIGSKEGIMHICMAFLNDGDKVLIPDPGYPTYSSAVRLSGGIPVYYNATEFSGYASPLEDIAREHGSIKMMFVNFPHMPTGMRGSTQLFSSLLAFARKYNILIVHDNPYSFILQDKPVSFLSVPGAKEHVIELNSLSKSHNMAGWRVGMMIAEKSRIDTVLTFKSNMDSGMFLPIQLAAAKALQLGKEWHDRLNQVYNRRRKIVYTMLEELECTWTVDQSGLFTWAKVPQGHTGESFSDLILDRSGVFITPGFIFGKGGNDFIRISLCSNEEVLTKALNRIKTSLIA